MADYPTLDEISQMPEGPNELAQHLYANGYATPPPPPPPPAPVIPDANVAPMAPASPYAGAGAAPRVPAISPVNLGGTPDLGGTMRAISAQPSMGTLEPVHAWNEKDESIGAPWRIPPRSAPTPRAITPSISAPPVPGSEMVPPEITGMPAGGGTPAIPTPGPPMTLTKPTKQQSKEAEQEERKLNIAQYYRERPQITASPGTVEYNNQVQAQMAYDKNHPLGAPISRMPGTKGKILHDLAMAGEIGGFMVAPQIVSQIPGTRPYMSLRQHAAEAEAERLRPQELAAANAPFLQKNLQAETGLRGAEQAEKERQTQLLGIPQDEVGYQVRSLMTGGPGGGPQINPATQKPYTQFEAYRDIKQAGERTPEAQIPLGADRIAQLNREFADRRKVLNPGETTPPLEWQLPPNATWGDAQLMDKVMQQQENAVGVKSQRDFSRGQQLIAEQDRKRRIEDAEEQKGLTMVTGRYPDENREVMVPLSQAKDLNLQNKAKAEPAEITRTEAARDAYKIYNNSDPNDPGVWQMMQKMSPKDLGPIAGRYNEFMAGTVGVGKPQYTQLRARMMLGQTKLMQAHAGNTGRQFLFEHFQNLADSGKMDLPTLKYSIATTIQYLNDISKWPPGERPDDATGAVPSRVHPAATAGGAAGPPRPAATVTFGGKDYTVGADGTITIPGKGRYTVTPGSDKLTKVK